MTDQVYEVWNFLGHGKPDFVSDDPVEIANWIRARPPEERGFNVHPVGKNFHSGSLIAHDFIWKHRMAVAEDMVKKAWESGNPDGLAKAIIDLVFGR